jgi:hypothetical protein
MVAAIESECWPDSYRNGGRFPAGMVAGFVWNTHKEPFSSFFLILKQFKHVKYITVNMSHYLF